MSAELEQLFSFEARSLEPLYVAYVQSPSLETGRAYEVPAMRWLRDATTALQAVPDTDVWKARVGQRFDVVVRSIQKIDNAGHGTKTTGAEVAQQFVADTASGFVNNVKAASSISLDWGGDALKNAAWIVGGIVVLYIAVRVLR